MENIRRCAWTENRKIETEDRKIEDGEIEIEIKIEIEIEDLKIYKMFV